MQDEKTMSAYFFVTFLMQLLVTRSITPKTHGRLVSDLWKSYFVFLLQNFIFILKYGWCLRPRQAKEDVIKCKLFGQFRSFSSYLYYIQHSTTALQNQQNVQGIPQKMFSRVKNNSKNFGNKKNIRLFRLTIIQKYRHTDNN